MHSTSSSENRPSSVTCLCPMPRVFSACSIEFFRAAQLAADVRADLHVILPERLLVQHRVVADHFVHLQPGYARGAWRTPASILPKGGRPHPGNTAASGSEPSGCGPADRRPSISQAAVRVRARKSLPVHVSEYEIHAAHRGDRVGDQFAFDTSRGSDCRLPKLGVRMKTRCGLDEPSLTT